MDQSRQGIRKTDLHGQRKTHLKKNMCHGLITNMALESFVPSKTLIALGAIIVVFFILRQLSRFVSPDVESTVQLMSTILVAASAVLAVMAYLDDIEREHSRKQNNYDEVTYQLWVVADQAWAQDPYYQRMYCEMNAIPGPVLDGISPDELRKYEIAEYHLMMQVIQIIENIMEVEDLDNPIRVGIFANFKGWRATFVKWINSDRLFGIYESRAAFWEDRTRKFIATIRAEAVANRSKMT